MPNCVVKGCKNRTNYHKKAEGITYHMIPRDPKTKIKWIDALIKLGRDANWCPSDKSVICSNHFHSEDFTTTKNGKRVKLKPKALPIYKVNANSYIPINDADNEDVTNDAETNFIRKRALNEPKGQTNKKSRHDIDDIVIDYDNIDKFGEQIAFLLKMIPRQLCRELQESIVTLVKTETKKYENENKRDAEPSTKVVDILSQIVLTPTLVTKPNVKEEIVIKQEPVEEETQVKKLEETDLRGNIIHKTIELDRNLVIVKQERLEESGGHVSDCKHYKEDSEIILPERFVSNIKVEIEEFDLNEQAMGKANLNNNYNDF